MHADCARPEVIQMPCNVSLEKGGNVFVRLTKAVNGLRSAPLSWYKEISSFLESEGFTQIIDPTIFRKFVWRNDARLMSVVLFYVDDILIWSQLDGEAERIFDMLAKKYKLKRTGFIEEGREGEVTFLGRKIFRTKEMAGQNAVMFGLEPAYLWSCCEEFQITHTVNLLIVLSCSGFEFVAGISSHFPKTFLAIFVGNVHTDIHDSSVILRVFACRCPCLQRELLCICHATCV